MKQGNCEGCPNAEWRRQFPYRWQADDVVTRRDMLLFMLAGSGALFAATAAMAFIGSRQAEPAAAPVPVARLGELAPNQWKVFDYPDRYGQGILINLPEHGLVAYSDVCTHLSCAVVYAGDGKHLHCPCHEGYFDAVTGDVVAGPPTVPLPRIELSIQGDTVYALRMVRR